jgi:23S rRNA pseudouridine2457 synthase
LKHFIAIQGVYPVGRLDRDSEGLMLLTSDGVLQHRLTDPKYEHAKTYWVQVEGIPAKVALEALTSGVQILDYTTRPARTKVLNPEPSVPTRNPPIRQRKSIPTTWIELTLTEGRNRQVRRMTAAIGFPTLRLIRVAIGSLQLGDLPPGAWRDLSAEESRLLRVSGHSIARPMDSAQRGESDLRRSTGVSNSIKRRRDPDKYRDKY